MNTRIILLFSICVFCFSSCSIEKRHYTKGVYLEWFGGKHTLPGRKDQFFEPKEIKPDQVVSASISTESEATSLEDFSKPQPSKKHLQQNQYSKAIIDTPIHSIEIKQYDPQTKSYVNAVYTDKVLNGWALAASLAIISCLIFPLISIYTLLVLAPFAAIASIIALIQIYSNPIKYKGEGLALISLVLASVIILLIILFIKNFYN